MKSYRVPVLWGLVAAVVLIASPQILVAETIVYPPPFGRYLWQGSHNGNQIGNPIGNNDPITFTGGGDAGDWARNWFGRYQATADSGCTSGCQPAVFMGLPPQDGDGISFTDELLPATLTGPFSISGGSVSLPSSGVGFGIYADFSGGSYDVAGIGIVTNSAHSGTFPVNFDGTTFRANQAFAATAVQDTLTLQGATINSPLIELSGQYTFEAPAPPPDGTPLISITGGSQIVGGVIKVSRGFPSPGDIRASRVKVSESILRGFGLAVGFGHSDAPAEVTLMNGSDAVFTQFLSVGQEGRGQLTLEGTSKMLSPAAYGIIGSQGPGFLHISDHSEVSLDTIQIGLNDEGELAIDTTGKLITNDGILGEIAGKQGAANVETSGRWETDKLTVGKNGIGYLYVRDQGTVKIEEEAILGEHESGHGFLYLIGANSHLELAQGSSLSIGKEGSGTLNIQGGGKAESDTDLLLGAQKQGVGTIDIDGAGSELHTKNKLYIGNGDAAPMGTGTNGTGTITVRNGGLIKADKDVVLGLNGGSHGVVNLYGAQSKLELAQTATLTIGNSGIGELNLYEGATFTSTGEVKLGELDGSDGTVRIDGQNSHWNVQGKLTIGDKTRGHVEVVNKGKLTVPAEELQLGNEVDSNGQLVVDGDGTEVNVGGNLFIGQRGIGVVEIKNKGKLTVPGVGVFLGTQAQGDGTLTLDGEGSSLNFSGQLIVADFGKGKITLQNEADFTTGDLKLGNFANSQGTLEVKGVGGVLNKLTTFTVNGALTAGAGGKGIINVENGGRLTTLGDAIVGESSTSGTENDPSKVTVTGDESHWKIGGNLTVGKRGKAEMTVENGSKLTIDGGTLNVGEENGSDGWLKLTRTGDRVAPVLDIDAIVNVGKAGKGAVVIEGDNVRADVRLLAIGRESTGDGTVVARGKGSRLKVSDEITIGGFGKGELTVQEAAEIRSEKKITIDASAAEHAVASISGFEGNDFSSLIAPRIVVGENGYGELEVEDGAFVNGPTGNLVVQVAVNQNSHGKVSIEGNEEEDSSITAQTVEVGTGGSGELIVDTDARLNVSQAMTLGAASETCTSKVEFKALSLSNVHDLTALNGSTINIMGGSVNAESVQMGGSQSRPAVLNVSGGNLGIENGIRTLFAGSKGKAIVNITELGAIEAVNIIVGNMSSDIQQGSQLTATGSSTSTGAVNIVVHKGASLTAAAGAQVAALEKATINGTVNVRGGAMPIGEFAGGATVQLGAVTVGGGGTLLGKGTILGNLYGSKFEGPYDNKPKVKPGNTPGVLTVEGDVVLETGTILEVELGGLAPGTQYDQLIATGSITLKGILEPVIVNSGDGFQLPSIGDQFTFLSAAGGVTSAFENAAALKSVAGGSLVAWSIASGANNAVLQAASITPLTDGDYNGDGSVDAADYVVWRHTAGGINLAADGNRDGVVDNVDYNVWRANFGRAAGSGSGANSTAAVPEPATVILVIIAVASRSFRRRRPA